MSCRMTRGRTGAQGKRSRLQGGVFKAPSRQPGFNSLFAIDKIARQNPTRRYRLTRRERSRNLRRLGGRTAKTGIAFLCAGGGHMTVSGLDRRAGEDINEFLDQPSAHFPIFLSAQRDCFFLKGNSAGSPLLLLVIFRSSATAFSPGGADASAETRKRRRFLSRRLSCRKFWRTPNRLCEVRWGGGSAEGGLAANVATDGYTGGSLARVAGTT